MMFNIKIKEYAWVGFPVVMAGLIMVSAWYLWGQNDDQITTLMGKRNQTVENEQKLNNLKTKLAKLEASNEDELMNDYIFLTKILPEVRLAWVLAGEMKAAASQSALIVTSYTGTVGNVLMASPSAVPAARTANDTGLLTLNWIFDSPDFAAVNNFIQTMENYYPLVKFNEVTVEENRLSVAVEGGYKQQDRVGNDPFAVLPAYEAGLAKIKSRTEEMRSYFEESNYQVDSGDAVESLF